MNILKLARHLKKFTLDEIEMIAECDCKTELERLLNDGKLAFEQGTYKIPKEKPVSNFELFVILKNKITPDEYLEKSATGKTTNYRAKTKTKIQNAIVRTFQTN